jgi:two-component sensor histidine kinase/Tfp pilus assembly protein PilF
MALKIVRELGDENGEGNVLMNMGVSHYYRGNYDSAMVYFMKTLEIRERANDSLRISQCFNNIGLLYESQGNYTKAKEYCKRAAAIKVNFSNKKSLLNTYDNLCTISHSLEEYDTAFYYAQLALDLATQLNDSSELGSAFGNMGVSYLKIGDHRRAIEYLEKAAVIIERTDRLQSLPICYHNMGDAYAADGSTKKANEFYLKSLALAEEQEMVKVQLENLLSLSESFEKAGDAKNGLAYFKRYHQLYQKSFDLEKASVIEGLNTKYETEKKENEIQLLSAGKEKDQAEIASKNAQRNLFIGLSAAAVVLLMVGGFFFLRIQTKNKQIAMALEEKGVLIKEIHHRVKNSLQLISSLLSLQSRHVHDEKASQALRGGMNRVTSVGLIHQRLYQEDNLTGVLMHEYVPQLVTELMALTDSRHIKVDLDIAKLNLDVDTVIPMGLMLNELVTNVLKYASKQEEGLLQIVLKETNGELLLSVRDTGPGLPADFDPKKTNSYGMKLIASLCLKLDAEVKYINQNPGLEVQVIISKYKFAA